MSYVYRAEWQGRNTGWDYRCELIPPGDGELQNPEIAELPVGSLEFESLKMKYEKIPFGCGESPTAKIKIYLDEIPKDAKYNELRLRLWAATINVNAGGVLGTIQAGLVVRLWVRFNKNSAPDVNVWRHVWSGMVRHDAIAKFDLSDKTIQMEAVDLSRAVLEVIKFSALRNAISAVASQQEVSSDVVVEAVFTQDGRRNVIANSFGSGYEIKFVPLKLLTDEIKELGNIVYRKFLRNSAEQWDLQVVMPRFYRQIYSGSGSLGGELAPNGVCVAWRCVKDGQELPFGVFDERDEAGFAKRYNSAWDYIVDLTEWSAARAEWRSRGLAMRPLFSVDETVEVAIERFSQFEINFVGSGLKRVNVSNVEVASGGEFADVGNWVEQADGSRNEGELCVANVWSNSPPAVEYKQKAANFVNGKYKLWLGEWVRTTGLWYFERPEAFSRAMPIRVCEGIRYDRGDGTTTAIDETYDWRMLAASRPSEKCLGCQTVSGVMKWLAKYLASEFVGVRATAKGRIDADECVWFEGGGSLGFVWFGQGYKYRVLGLAEMLGVGAPAVAEMRWLGAEWNLRDEEVEIEMIG